MGRTGHHRQTGPVALCEPCWTGRQDRPAGPGPLRDEIVASWERCARAGLRPDRFEVPYDGDVDYRGRACWAAGPVLDRVGGDLDGTGAGSC